MDTQEEHSEIVIPRCKVPGKIVGTYYGVRTPYFRTVVQKKLGFAKGPLDTGFQMPLEGFLYPGIVISVYVHLTKTGWIKLAIWLETNSKEEPIWSDSWFTHSDRKGEMISSMPLPWLCAPGMSGKPWQRIDPARGPS
jgi:hypothetical protein